MKAFSKSVGLVIISLLLSASLSAQIRDKDVFINRLFESIKTTDEKAFNKLFPDLKGFIRLMKEMKEKNPGMDDFDTKELELLTEEQYQVLGTDETFLGLLEQGEKKGIKWSEVTMESWKVDTVSKKSGDLPATLMLTGTINIKFGQKKYHFSFDDIIWADEDKCWYGVSLGELEED